MSLDSELLSVEIDCNMVASLKPSHTTSAIIRFYIDNDYNDCVNISFSVFSHSLKCSKYISYHNTEIHGLKTACLVTAWIYNEGTLDLTPTPDSGLSVSDSVALWWLVCRTVIFADQTVWYSTVVYVLLYITVKQGRIMLIKQNHQVGVCFDNLLF